MCPSVRLSVPSINICRLPGRGQQISFDSAFPNFAWTEKNTKKRENCSDGNIDLTGFDNKFWHDCVFRSVDADCRCCLTILCASSFLFFTHVLVFILLFTARCYASAVLAMGPCLCQCLSVCPSVCLSQVGVLLKRLNGKSHKQHHTIVQGL